MKNFWLVCLLTLTLSITGCKQRKVHKMVIVQRHQHHVLAEENTDGYWFYFYPSDDSWTPTLRSGDISLPSGSWRIGPGPRSNEVEEEEECDANEAPDDPAEAESESSTDSSSTDGNTSTDSSSSSDSSSSDGGGGGGDGGGD